MSRKDNETEYEGSGGFQASSETSALKTAPTFCAIEDHAVSMNVSSPVFAAVRQYKGWSAGKKVEKAEFEKAVKDFLNAPIGSAAPVGGKINGVT